MSKFKPNISNISSENGELKFILSGSDNYGLDKSIVNGIRRALLTDIPSIAFKTEEQMNQKDIHIVTNTTSLHNEMLLQRMSLIPLYIDPENYMKNYLFELKVIHDGKNPFQFVTTNDMNIYPLNSELQKRIDNFEEEDTEELDTLLNSNNPDNYDMNNPLSQKRKDEILRPFQFRGSTNYILITELKNTNSEDFKQEIHCYGCPSLSTGKENARFQPVSCATYSFLKDDSLVNTVLQERILVEKVEEEDIESFTTKFMLAESERYYCRDFENEPHKYNFTIKSVHQYDSAKLFKQAITILMEKLVSLKLSFIALLKNEDTCVSSLKVNDFLYHYTINDEGHTLGNMIQSHITRRSINDKSMLQLCGYKKPHPLEESMKLILSLNPKHKVMKETEQNKFMIITNFLMEELETIRQELKLIVEACDIFE